MQRVASRKGGTEAKLTPGSQKLFHQIRSEEDYRQMREQGNAKSAKEGNGRLRQPHQSVHRSH